MEYMFICVFFGLKFEDWNMSNASEIRFCGNIDDEEQHLYRESKCIVYEFSN